MEDFCINSTSQDESYNYSNITFGSENHAYNKKVHFIKNVVTCIIIVIGLPLTLVAIYALYSLIQKDHVAPIYVINLLISDLIQLCSMIGEVAPTVDSDIVSEIYLSTLVSSVGFMVCVALERYLVITCPLWYRCRRTIKSSVVVCVLVWTLPLVFVLSFHFWDHFQMGFVVFGIFLLLPLPLFIFFLVGTLKALSASISVPSDEKRRIVGVLVLVLLIYTLLFLPKIIWFLTKGVMNDFTLHQLSGMFLRLNPLADLALYVFMKKGTIDKLLASVCCCRMDSNDITSTSV